MRALVRFVALRVLGSNGRATLSPPPDPPSGWRLDFSQPGYSGALVLL